MPSDLINSRDNDQMDAYDVSKYEYAKNKLRAPVVLLIVVTMISILCLCLALGTEVYIQSTGINEQIRQRQGISEKRQFIQFTIRVTWTIVMVISNFVTVLAGINLLRVKNSSVTKMGLILALIPFTGPCFLLGIPFAIWSYGTMSSTDIAEI